MKSFVLTIAASSLLVGCKPAAKAPATGFRLTVQEIVSDPEVCGAVLTIHTKAAGAAIVSQDGGHTSIILPGADESGTREATVTLLGSRVAPPGEGDIQIQTLIRLQTSPGNFGGGPSNYTLPRTTRLEDHFTITATSGDHLSNTAIEIARLRGKPVTLTVGTPAK